MPRRPRHRAAADRAVARPTPSRGPDVAAVIALIGIVWLVFRGALPYFFGQDDFAGLARARGILPPLATPWRWLAGQGYFAVMRAVADLHPAAYHAASLAAHAVNAALLYVLLSRHVGRVSAFGGAALFAAHPALYTALYSISGIGEILALTFALATLLLAMSRGGRRWLAPVTFAASLACKESTLLLPLVAVAALRGRLRPGLVAALGAVALGWAALLYASNVFGVRSGLPGQAAYALRFDTTLFGNLFTYLGWTVHALAPTVHGWSDANDAREYGWGVAALVAWLAGACVPALRARGWLVGGALYLALLAPVLPLGHHTYHYYLYGPLAGTAACAAAALDVALAGTWVPRQASANAVAAASAAVLVAALATWNGHTVVSAIEAHPFMPGEPGEGATMRADPVVDRALIAARAVRDVRDAALPAGTALAFWSPIAHGHLPADSAGYWERNVQSALFDGIGVRVCVPQVHEVRFEHTFRMLPDPWRWAVYRPDGALHVATSAELARVLPQFLPQFHPPAADSASRPGG